MVTAKKYSVNSHRPDYLAIWHICLFFVSVCINICFSTGSIVSEVPESVNAADGAVVSNKLPPQLFEQDSLSGLSSWFVLQNVVESLFVEGSSQFLIL